MPFEVAAHFQPHWPIRHVLFDLDGTLSLVRAGWAEIMVEMFLEHLPAEDRPLILENIWSRNGRPTLHQMEWLAGHLQTRGQEPISEPAIYLGEFQRRLLAVADARLTGDPEGLLVHGARAMLDALQARGLVLHLASGTEESLVRRDVELLGLASYFGERVHGAPAGLSTYSKALIIAAILRDFAIGGTALLAFGDGQVETVAVKEVGGLAVAVASDELENGSGRVDAEKRARLLACGADVVIADYREPEALLAVLLAE